MMSGHEGVIKYRLMHQSLSLRDPLCCHGIEDLVACPSSAVFQSAYEALEAWRCRLFEAGLIGRDPVRYGGLGYGNISLRLPTGGFLVTGSQTGHSPLLSFDDYVWVRDWRIDQYELVSMGLLNPSSEAFTHAAVYQSFADVQAVMHVHWPQVWHRRDAMQLLQTSARVEYGSLDMAASICTLLEGRISEVPVLAMAGHEDGLLVAARTLDEAGEALLALEKK